MTYLAFIPSVLCFSIAGWLAVKGKEGWGWFLFVGLLATSAYAGPGAILTVN